LSIYEAVGSCKKVAKVAKLDLVILLLPPFYLSLWGRVLWLPVGKVTFACYSISNSSRSSLICLTWKQYKLPLVLNSNLIFE